MAEIIKVDGVEQLTEKLRSLYNVSDETLAKALLDGAFVLEGEIKVSMQQTSKGGNTYERGAKTHTSSAPGSPPAVDYGFLINSVQSAQDGNDAIVFTDDEAALPLELGTAKVAARPFMRPAAAKHQAKVIKAIEISAKKRIESDAR